MWQLTISIDREEYIVIEGEGSQNFFKEGVRRILILIALISRRTGSGLLNTRKQVGMGTRVVMNTSNDFFFLSHYHIHISTGFVAGA